MTFIESILFENGHYHHLNYHQQRFDRTLDEFYSKKEKPQLTGLLPPLQLEGVYKVRLVYAVHQDSIDFDVEYAAYIPRKIDSLQVIHADPFDYSFKYEDRSKLQTLVDKSSAEEILISINGQITDCSYANLAFWDGDRWLTPDTPLLRGVRRQQLLDQHKLHEASIDTCELHRYSKVSIINAMLDLGELEVDLDLLIR